MKEYVFEDKKISSILEWWLDMYSFKLYQDENGILIEDLQTLEKEHTTEEQIIDYFIEQIKGKLEYEEVNRFRNDLEALINYKNRR